MKVETEIKTRTSIPTFSIVSAAATVRAEDGVLIAHESTEFLLAKRILVLVDSRNS